ncbi:MAG: hypothetical protein WBH47_14050 [Streptosporangiaceae bacterium]
MTQYGDAHEAAGQLATTRWEMTPAERAERAAAREAARVERLMSRAERLMSRAESALSVLPPEQRAEVIERVQADGD